MKIPCLSSLSDQAKDALKETLTEHYHQEYERMITAINNDEPFLRPTGGSDLVVTSRRRERPGQHVLPSLTQTLPEYAVPAARFLSFVPQPASLSGSDHNSSISPPMQDSDATVSEEEVSPVTPERHLLQALQYSNYAHPPQRTPTPAPPLTASQLKRSFSVSQGRAGSGKKLTGENDPENWEILRLRQEENKEFGAIADVINAKRVKTGSAKADLTANAIYSRYKRNGPLIVANEGKNFVPTPKDKKSNGSSINFRRVTPIVGFDYENADLYLVQAVADIDATKWELVSERVVALGGRKHAPDMCAMRFSRI